MQRPARSTEWILPTRPDFTTPPKLPPAGPPTLLTFFVKPLKIVGIHEITALMNPSIPVPLSAAIAAAGIRLPSYEDLARLGHVALSSPPADQSAPDSATQGKPS